jgi:hypothetical protein
MPSPAFLQKIKQARSYDNFFDALHQHIDAHGPQGWTRYEAVLKQAGEPAIFKQVRVIVSEGNTDVTELGALG